MSKLYFHGGRKKKKKLGLSWVKLMTTSQLFCLWLVFCNLLLTTSHLLFATSYLLLATCYLLLTTCFLLLITCYLLLGSCLLLLASDFLLLATWSTIFVNCVVAYFQNIIYSYTKWSHPISLFTNVDFILVDATYEWRDGPAPWPHHRPWHVQFLIVNLPLHRARQHGR